MNNLNSAKKTWAITTFFNSQRYSKKIFNYKRFKKGLENQGVPLLVVECAFGDYDFELNKNDADILVQVRSNSVLWQKERLLNIALKHLPVECENIVWVDADIIFLNDNWVTETEELLKKYSIVQPFKRSIRLGRWENIDKALKSTPLPNQIRDSYAFYYTRTKNKIPYFETDGGFAWAAKKTIFDTCGFYDFAILGGADWIMNGVFVGAVSDNELVNKWGANIKKIVNDIYYTNGQVIHLYHGSMLNRGYGIRGAILEKNNYNPKRDLCLNEDGCWEWSQEAPESLKREVTRFFKSRNEEHKFFSKISKKYIIETIGQIGLLIKSISPKLYNFLQKFK